jgi:hypothetical protein
MNLLDERIDPCPSIGQRRTGAPFLAFFARRPALSEVEGWGFSPTLYQPSVSAPRNFLLPPTETGD